jgi:hypothetical protein
MITHPNIGHAGRLGNAMFQYSALKGIARKCEYKPVLLKDVHNRIWDGQLCLLRFFNLKIDYIDDISNFNDTFAESSAREFDDRVYMIQPNTLIYGHYESYRYFQDIEDEIRSDFELLPEIKSRGSILLENVKTNSDTQTIAIHIRLGDYSHIYKDLYSNKSHWIHTFIHDALKKFEHIRNKQFIAFTGGNKQDTQDREDIDFTRELLSQYIPENQLFMSQGNEPIIDFSMITQVNHVIVLTFSTFIWWASFLNSSESKKIIVPKNAMFAKDTDFWHPSFIQI